MDYGNEIYNNFDTVCEVDSSLVAALSQSTARRKKTKDEWRGKNSFRFVIRLRRPICVQEGMKKQLSLFLVTSKCRGISVPILL